MKSPLVNSTSTMPAGRRDGDYGNERLFLSASNVKRMINVGIPLTVSLASNQFGFRLEVAATCSFGFRVVLRIHLLDYICQINNSPSTGRVGQCWKRAPCMNYDPKEEQALSVCPT